MYRFIYYHSGFFLLHTFFRWPYQSGMTHLRRLSAYTVLPIKVIEPKNTSQMKNINNPWTGISTFIYWTLPRDYRWRHRINDLSNRTIFWEPWISGLSPWTYSSLTCPRVVTLVTFWSRGVCGGHHRIEFSGSQWKHNITIMHLISGNAVWTWELYVIILSAVSATFCHALSVRPCANLFWK